MLSSAIFNRIGHLSRSLSASQRQSLRAFCSSLNKNEELLKTPLSKNVDKSMYPDDEPTPVVYTKSKAFGYKASENFRMPTDSPPSQYYFVTGSVAAFLIYFILLREENDLDEKLYTPWAGNENIYRNILEVQLKNNTDVEEIAKIKQKIKELDETIRASTKNDK